MSVQILKTILQLPTVIKYGYSEGILLIIFEYILLIIIRYDGKKNHSSLYVYDILSN